MGLKYYIIESNPNTYIILNIFSEPYHNFEIKLCDLFLILLEQV